MNKNLDAWAASLHESNPSTPHDRALGFLAAFLVSFALWGVIIGTALILAT